MSYIYWPPTRPRDDGGTLANWGWSYRAKPACKASTDDPRAPYDYELECCRPEGHTGRHFDWEWSDDGRCIITGVWGAR